MYCDLNFFASNLLTYGEKRTIKISFLFRFFRQRQHLNAAIFNLKIFAFTYLNYIIFEHNYKFYCQ